jgi:hypothetical protein
MRILKENRMEMMILVGILVAVVLYLRFTIWKDDEKLVRERDELKAMLDNIDIESPYKVERPIVATKRKTRKRTVKSLPKKKLKVVKKKTIKKKVINTIFTR